VGLVIYASFSILFLTQMPNRRRRTGARMQQQQVHLIGVEVDILNPYLKVYILNLKNRDTEVN
jgi:hypothetical protein